MSTAVTHHWRTEVIDGVEREIPTPKPLHIRIQNRMEEIMFAAARANPEFEVLPGLDVLLDRGKDYLCPDIVVTRADAVYADNDMQFSHDRPCKTPSWLHASDALLAVEILSPGQTVQELFGKCDLLHEAGCPICWVICGEKRRAWISIQSESRTEVTDRLWAHTLPSDFHVSFDYLFDGVPGVPREEPVK
jgi:Uma2 family endonuclease